jgi:pyrroline-5-carboxylate reductase
MANKSIGFIGGGRITRIFLEANKRAGISNQNVIVSDVNTDGLAALHADYPEIEISPNDNTRPALCDVVFLAVHPPMIGAILADIAPKLQQNAIFVSLAPKFTIVKLMNALGGFGRIARMIPNAPSVIGAGYNPIAYASALTDEDKSILMSVLAPLGQSPVVLDENLEAYALITAMGPTYFWFQWAELKKLALSFGLSEVEAEVGIKHMLGGAIKTMFESGMSEAAVIDLIPVKPLADEEAGIKAAYETKLTALYEKLTS